ncbi:MAG: hypothetical protein K9G24_08495 [Candidatus Nanopelagicales bacterium]|nr:hypothetical protein [Candidatus Nanopelagicales bacterium]MCF8537330.1 hypothetical protein [Candidatus Nanopelagicales bacterium]MCF8543104.1 hypothetical protein [Candidatus Nanopelagicales bacterium]MCF8557193.1 hypothetical protein [Candidatus Nanopelagicales bacterium]
MSELARALGSPLTTVQSEVSRLEETGLFTSRKVGRARVVRPNADNPLMEPLRQLIMLTFGPPVVLARELALPGVQSVVIFGSWAARFAGEAGSTPADIDVLVIGDGIDRDEVYRAAERSEDSVGRPINPVIRSTAAWANPETDALLDEIARRPIVEVMSAPADTLHR